MELGSVLIAGLAVVISAASVSVAITQNRLNASSVAADWIRDFRTWASEALGVLAEAAYTCRSGDVEPTADEAACLRRCRHRLSGLIDSGRLLLPNDEQDAGATQHKAVAYRGYRHPALDALVAADKVLGDDLPLAKFPDKKQVLIYLRREFVSYVYAIVDPASFNRQVARILRIAKSKSGMTSFDDNKRKGARWILEKASSRYLVELKDPSRD